MTVAGLIRVVWQVLVGGVLCGESDRAYRLIFITVFGTKVVMAYFPTLAPVGVVNKF